MELNPSILEPMEETPRVNPGTYSPLNVRVYDALGALLLGILAIMLMKTLIQCQSQNTVSKSERRFRL